MRYLCKADVSPGLAFHCGRKFYGVRLNAPDKSLETRPATRLLSRDARFPIRSAVLVSMVAIFAHLTTEANRSPARDKSETWTSSGHFRFSALVIIRIHSKP
jgi:hypothetical protein